MYKEGFRLEALFGGNFKINLKRLDDAEDKFFPPRFYTEDVNWIFFFPAVFSGHFQSMDIFGGLRSGHLNRFKRPDCPPSILQDEMFCFSLKSHGNTSCP